MSNSDHRAGVVLFNIPRFITDVTIIIVISSWYVPVGRIHKVKIYICFYRILEILANPFFLFFNLAVSELMIAAYLTSFILIVRTSS